MSFKYSNNLFNYKSIMSIKRKNLLKPIKKDSNI